MLIWALLTGSKLMIDIALVKSFSSLPGPSDCKMISLQKAYCLLSCIVMTGQNISARKEGPGVQVDKTFRKCTQSFLDFGA
jgi:hypothetical protein